MFWVGLAGLVFCAWLGCLLFRNLVCLWFRVTWIWLGWFVGWSLCLLICWLLWRFGWFTGLVGCFSGCGLLFTLWVWF